MRIACVRANDGEMTGAELSGLLQRASDGDQAAWELLVRLYSRRIFAMARSRCASDDAAEEITQSVFVTLATKLRSGGYTEQGKFEAWIFRVAMNRVRDTIRRARARKVVGESDIDLGQMASTDHAAGQTPGGRENGESMASLRAAIQRLSEADREIIELRHHAGLGFKEMAEILGEPIGTLLARHHRALRKLRDMLVPSGAGGTGQEGGT